MKALNVYLNFPGTTEKAFNFYKSVFGGEFTALQRFSSMPDASKMPPEVQQMIMHVALPIKNGLILMGTDASDKWGPKVIFGDNMHLSIEAESREEADTLYKGLSAEGKTTMPLADMFWGTYYGALVDKFGTCWMINYTPPKK